MDLMIYSDDALEMIRLGQMDRDETLEYYKKHVRDDAAQIKAIIGAYAAELIAAADEEGLVLDLTFDTVGAVQGALSALYNSQYKAGIADPRNKELTCRALAAYMDLLIINNFDDCAIDARRYPNKDNEARPDRWTGFLTLILDKKKNSDMLPFVWKGANASQEEVKNGFSIDIGPLAEGFRKLTGIKLTKSGLADMTLKHDDQEEENASKLILPGDEEKKLILPGDEDRDLILPGGGEKKLIL